MEEENQSLPPIGYINKKYIILKKLSSGGEGIVYLVKGISDNKYYAAKLQKKKTTNIEKEIKNLQELKERGCKGIIDYIDSGECQIFWIGKPAEDSEIKHYIILEFAPNRDLGDYICFIEEGFKEEYSKILFYKIVKDVKSIHDCNKCHRDLKLDNIMLNDKYNPKICDLSHAEENKPDLTGIIGTIDYRPPEVKKNSKYNGKKVDIFNLGMILIGLTTGKYKFYKQDKDNIYYGCLENNNISLFWKILESLDIKVSDQFKDLCSKMIAFHPKDRISLDKILEHEWFGDIRDMNDEQLKKYEDDIKLKEEIRRQKQKLVDAGICEHIRKKKANTRAKEDEEEGIFDENATPEDIDNIPFMSYYIRIKGLDNQVNFMNELFKLMYQEFKGVGCYIAQDKSDNNNKLKLEVKIKGEEMSEYNQMIMEIILYQTKEEYFLRLERKQMQKYDFIEKIKKICDLVKLI